MCLMRHNYAFRHPVCEPHPVLSCVVYVSLNIACPINYVVASLASLASDHSSRNATFGALFIIPFLYVFALSQTTVVYSRIDTKP